MMTDVDNPYRQRTGREIEQDVVALLAGAFGTEPGQDMPTTGRPPWSDADMSAAFVFMTSIFIDFARAADRAGVSFPDFLQHMALETAARDDREPSPAKSVRPGITFADDDGNIIAWFRITADGRLDAGGDTARWTPVAQSFIAELRRQAAQA